MIEKFNKKEMIKSGKALAALLFYLIFPYTMGIPFAILGIDTSNFSDLFLTYYQILFYLGMGALLIVIFKNDLKEAYKDIKKNHKKHFKFGFKYWAIGLGVMMITNLIIQMIIGTPLSGNEEAIRDLFKADPTLIFFTAVVFAPIAEELTFRQGFRNMFKTDTIFIIASGLVFGAMHVIPTLTQAIDVLYLIPYSALGLSFAYILAKTKNILVPIGFHFLHNGILVSIQLLALILGVA